MRLRVTSAVLLLALCAGPIARADDAPTRPKKSLAIGVGAVALAAFITGGALGGVAQSYSNEQNGNALMPSVYTQELADRGTLGRNLATGAYVCFGLGGVAAAIDLFLWIEALRKK